MIRVAIADDNAEMRVALRLLLSLSKEIELVCEAANGEEALDCVIRLQPDVLVMDIYLPDQDGFAVTEQIVEQRMRTRVILISLEIGSFVVMQAISAGAQGFVAKDDVARSLFPAIETVQRGETFFME
jgi:DNA-binding NarL/FixJ family response regulator